MKPAQIFHQYIWIINTLRAYGKLTLEELNQKWIAYRVADGNPLQRSSFNRHRDAIQDMFGIVIDCEPRTYKYFISNKEVIDDDSIESWLFSTLTVHGMLADSAAVKERLVLENAPVGEQFLDIIIRAIKTNHRLHIGYKKFEAEGYERVVCPYALKLFRRFLATGLLLRILWRADRQYADGPRRRPCPQVDGQLPAHAAPAPLTA